MRFFPAQTTPGALANLTSDQQVPGLALKTVSWEAAQYDDRAFFSLSNPTRLTVPIGITRIRIGARLSWASLPFSTNWQFQMLKNGAALPIGLPVFTGISPAATFTAPGQTIYSAPIDVVGGDFFELITSKGDAGNQDLASGSCWFAIEAVR